MAEKKAFTLEGNTAPLSLKVPPGLKQSIETTARTERRSPGNLSVLLLEWGFEQLQAAGDTATLRRSPGIPKIERVSRETQKELFSALRIILECGNSEVIKDISNRLTKAAGWYGKEK